MVCFFLFFVWQFPLIRKTHCRRSGMNSRLQEWERGNLKGSPAPLSCETGVKTAQGRDSQAELRKELSQTRCVESPRVGGLWSSPMLGWTFQ